jgi:hypothetical protein
MNRFTKRTATIVVAIAVTAGAASVAYAYWTAGGSGTGTAATGTNASITAVQTGGPTAMGPGDIAQSLNGKFNNTNSGPVYVTSVTASIASVVKAVGAPAGTCDLTDYTLATPVMAVGVEVPAGTGTGNWTGATLKFNNKAAVNQDACKGATVNLAYAIA